MAPLIFLVATAAIVHLAGRTIVPSWRPWPIAARAGVAVMFTVTGISHFIGMREALIDMVPPGLPAPEALVTITGILELAGAAGVLLAPTRAWAAGGLNLMLIAMFPANVHLALTGTNLAWDDTLVPRTVLQLIFLTATSAILVWDVRHRRELRERRRMSDGPSAARGSAAADHL